MEANVKVPRARYIIECRDKDGNLKWEEVFDNTVVDEGINMLLDRFFKGSSYTATWYLGLIGGGATIAKTDTMGSHAGWTEFSSYDEVSRPTIAFGTVGNKSLNNFESKAVFTSSATATVAGSFISTSSSKGTNLGILYSAALFSSGARSLAVGDKIAVTCSVSGV